MASHRWNAWRIRLLLSIITLGFMTLPVRSQTTTTISQTTASLIRITPGTSFQWQLRNTIDTSSNSRIYDIDVFDAPSTTISALKAAGHIVICYISVGSYEDWRPDSCKFPTSVRGKKLSGWKGETWLDIRNVVVLGPIMRARMELAKRKGCDGVEGDNVDGYSNDSGFPLTANDQVAYNRWLAETAHSLGLVAGLKNTLDLGSQLVDWYDFALLEQCVQFGSCDAAKIFLNVDKAVFDVEYIESNATVSNVCPVTNAIGIDAQVKNLQLDSGARNMCRSTYMDLTTANVTTKETSIPEPTIATGPCASGAGALSRHIPGGLVSVLFAVLSVVFVML
ncbi:hypothetical protein HDU93_003715 [Gonapodya sp. JEL0774]|nr:hypothetical protein HDU93_003715 [Gonapodya sp. JEL0774]